MKNERIRMLGLMKELNNEFYHCWRDEITEEFPTLILKGKYPEEMNNIEEEIIRDFEEQNNVLAFFVNTVKTSQGNFLNILFVSNDASSWEQDRKDLADDYCPLAYVYNLDNGHAEFRNIFIDMTLNRVA